MGPAPIQPETGAYSPLHEINRKLDRIIDILDGDENAPGLRTRVDRLEQKEVARTWWLRAVAAAAFASLGKIIIGK